MNLTVKQVFSDIKHIYLNLAQAYEAEFSKIVGKAPDENGIFPLENDILPIPPVFGPQLFKSRRL